MNLHVESRGAGRDLVLLHGWGMSGKCWEAVSEELSERFRVHLVDLPGHGSSEYSGRDWIDLLADAFPCEVFLCGWSLGGQLAIEWAERYPERVEKLVLVSSTPCFVAREGWSQGMPREVFEGFADALEKNPESALKRFLFLQARGGDEEKALLRKLLGYLEKADGAALKKGLDMLLESDLREAARNVSRPALVLHGQCDTLTPVEAGKWLAQSMRDARFAIIPGCAHAPFVSHPGLFASRLTEFLDES